jgi:hypothetical protein
VDQSKSLLVETVFPEFIPNLSTAQAFFRHKEDLFNTKMHRLGLPYRFKWFWETPDSDQVISAVMEQNEPP